ncbi:hypothetical protein [Vibrio parahaemolyticus]
MASSLGFWLDKKDSYSNNGNLEINSELHINYWVLPNEGINYLDIGVKLTNKPNAGNIESKIKSIVFYLPFEKKHIEYDSELGNVVCSDHELLSAIFNSYVTETSYITGSGIHSISLPDNKKMKFYTQIDQENGDGVKGVKISELNDKKEKGVQVTFPMDLFNAELESNVPIYFRFRIKILDNKAINRISNVTKSKAPTILGDFSKIEVIDFRINEARNLPYKIRKKVIDFQSINVIHFFLIREATSEFKVSHSDYKRCRLLETELWDKYLGLKDTKSQKLIYHWKQKTVGNISDDNEDCDSKSELFINHFSAFAKFSSNTIPKRAAVIVLLLSIIIGIASGLATNYIWNATSSSMLVDEKLQSYDVSIPKPSASNITCSMYWPTPKSENLL